jgi:hypothetical protein
LIVDQFIGLVTDIIPAVMSRQHAEPPICKVRFDVGFNQSIARSKIVYFSSELVERAKYLLNAQKQREQKGEFIGSMITFTADDGHSWNKGRVIRVDDTFVVQDTVRNLYCGPYKRGDIRPFCGSRIYFKDELVTVVCTVPESQGAYGERSQPVTARTQYLLTKTDGTNLAQSGKAMVVRLGKIQYMTSNMD